MPGSVRWFALTKSNCEQAAGYLFIDVQSGADSINANPLFVNCCETPMLILTINMKAVNTNLMAFTIYSISHQKKGILKCLFAFKTKIEWYKKSRS